MLAKIEHALTNIEKRLLQVLFISMTLLVLAQVLNRVFINYPMAWADEASRYLFVWVVYIASAYAVKEKAHIGVTALVDRFPPKLRHCVEIVVNIICMAFSLGLIYFAINIMRVQIEYGQRSPSMGLPMQYAYLALAVGGLFMAIHFIFQLCALVAPKKADSGETA